ncbi:CD2-associated protein isoform X3 [Salarias fasciatus]|uniref:CD2-associated protein isoform X3 n=1 Tax=Salarias fasciatus TaxID=181472 RepID=UPI00117656B3|nr:CD2-associated protein isoform X3 [Salarias fasciatus]
MEVVVEYDYDALHDDELTLRLGDVIKNVRYYEEDGWMEGDLNGKRGLFPDNFVKEVKKESKEVKEAKSETKEESAPPVRREKTSGNVANLVQRMSTIGIPTGGFHPHPPAASKKPKKRQCKAQFDYQPVNDDELELKVGDIIDITEEVEEGWWSGSLNGKSGLFPSNFVKELDPMADDGESNDAPAEETDGSAVDGSATPTSPPPSSGNGVIAQPKKIRGIGFGDIFKEGSVKLKARLPSPDTEEKKEKDTGEPGWWRGEIGGEEGVFPDNFVTPISDADKESPASRGSLKASPRPDSEEKPKKPPPPSKSTALKPEVPSADRKPHFRTEDRDKPTPDPKPSKPAAPVVPPKKPIPPPGRRPGGIPPKRPDKPLAPSPSLKHNGEVPSTRPKSEYEPFFPTKVKTLSGDWGEKSSDTADLMSFDELSSTSEKLSHPTADRPKMPGRRLPTQFGGGHSPSKEASADKSFKADEEDGAKAKQSETRKPSASTLSPSPSLHKPSADVVGLRAQPEPEEAGAQLDELRSQFKELLMSVELLKTQQTKEITDLRRALDEEIQKRVALQLEIESLKRSVHST